MVIQGTNLPGFEKRGKLHIYFLLGILDFSKHAIKNFIK